MDKQKTENENIELKSVDYVLNLLKRFKWALTDRVKNDFTTLELATFTTQELKDLIIGIGYDIEDLSELLELAGSVITENAIINTLGLEAFQIEDFIELIDSTIKYYEQS